MERNELPTYRARMRCGDPFDAMTLRKDCSDISDSTGTGSADGFCHLDAAQAKGGQCIPEECGLLSI